MPIIEKLHQQYRSKGLLVLGLNDEEPEVLKAFYKKGEITFPTVTDRAKTVRAHYGGNGIPYMLFLNRKGKVAGEALGRRPEAELRRMLRRAGLK